MTTCRTCSHDKGAHEHYRSGSDCSSCDCRRFRRRLHLPTLHRVHTDVEHAAPHRRRKIDKAA